MSLNSHFFKYGKYRFRFDKLNIKEHPQSYNLNDFAFNFLVISPVDSISNDLGTNLLNYHELS